MDAPVFQAHFEHCTKVVGSHIAGPGHSVIDLEEART